MADVFELRVVSLKLETSRAITLYLQPINPPAFRYEAGQFLTLMIESRGRMLRRSYSFSSTPGIENYIAITIKEVVNGEVSRLLLQTIKEGTILQALKPAGLFTLTTNPSWQRDVFFIAAGSGITPIYSMLKKVLHYEPLSRCILVYQNTSQAQTIFYEDLLALQKKFPKSLQLIFLFSQPGTHGISERLTQVRLEHFVHNEKVYEQNDTRFCICGPKAFMRMAEFTLRSIGYSASQIRVENFVVDQIPEPSFMLDATPRNVLVNIDDHQYSFTVSYPQNILQAALVQGLELPYSCKGGRCSSCVAKCVKGNIHMSINEVLTDEDLEQGYVLPCVGYAETDVELQYYI